MRLAALLAAGKACLEEVQSLGHVSPPETDADVVWLVVHRAGEEQDADFGQPRAVPGEPGAVFVLSVEALNPERAQFHDD